MSPGTQSALRPSSGEIPRYRLVSRIATGGMSEVFLALMSGALGSVKPVVIKRLWPELAGDPAHVQMFLDEARLSLHMAHPNVVHAFESGIDGDRHFLALEFLDGQSLKHLIEAAGPDGGLSLPLALKIICDVLAALQYVHDLPDLSGRPLRVVHRDVSPQNVFITYEGSVKLVDFGIAQSGGVSAPPVSEGKGRVAYMAPEQLAGGRVDARADLFSVGVMLWELATGRRLWEGMSESQVAEHLRARQPLPPLPRNRGFPPGLAAVCARALAPDPEQRYAHASQFLFDLGQLLTGSMPIHTRLLGDLMCRLFSHARTLSRTMLQQGLPGPPTGRADSELPLPTPPPELGVLSNCATSTSIAVPGDEITLVRPARVPQPVPSRARRGLRVAVGLTLSLALLAAGVAMGRSVAKMRSVSSPIVPAAIEPGPVESPKATPYVIPMASVDESTPTPLPPSGPPPARARRTVRRPPPKHTSPVIEPTPPASADSLPRIQYPAGRPIDREDPYGP